MKSAVCDRYSLQPSESIFERVSPPNAEDAWLSSTPRACT
jgi:hypothetical protein